MFLTFYFKFTLKHSNVSFTSKWQTIYFQEDSPPPPPPKKKIKYQTQKRQFFVTWGAILSGWQTKVFE